MAVGAHAAEEAGHAAESAAHGGEHAAGVFPPFDASSFGTQLFWFALTFGALYLVLSRVVLPKVGSVVDARAKKLKTDHDAAAADSAGAEAARLAAENALAKARGDARTLIEAKRAEVLADLAEEQAKAEAVLLERANAAETRIASARAKALGEVDAVANELATAIAAKLMPASERTNAAAAAARPRRIVEREGENR